eukprot:jgi/Psemu1/30072/gm1.30072_g
MVGYSISKCIVELLKAIWNLCFQSSRTKVHPVTNMLRAIRKLLCTQQRSLDAASYVKMMKENLEVVKSLGGTLICKATVSYKLECNPTYVAYDYDTYLTLTGTTRTATDHANNYPTTSVEALDMVVAFKDSKKSTQSRGNNQNNSTVPSDGSKEGNRKRDSSNYQEWGMFAQQGSGTGNNLSTDQHSWQLLMTAMESGERLTPSEQTTYMFLNVGIVSQGNTETLADNSSSTSSISTSNSDDDSSRDDEEDQ